MTSRCTVVVPCYNEARRLDLTQLDALAESADARVLIVDDGSTDDTAALLGKLLDTDANRYRLLSLVTNRGKGEAVRRGLLAAIGDGAELVAYCDADFATPPAEVARLIATLRSDERIEAVLGSRVAMLGSHIRRSSLRHYTGRLFATAGSLVLGVDVYDTQCGAKAFRVTAGLRDALADPFVSRWAFDVELLGRLLRTADASGRAPDGRFVEMPLQTWQEPGGSKLTAFAAARAGLDLLRIRRALRAGRRPRSLDRLDEQGDGA